MPNGRRNHTTDDAPRPSTPLLNDPKRPTNPPNPPRRRGRLKTRSLEESVPGEGLTKSYDRVKTESGESDRSDTLYMELRGCWSDPEARHAKTRRETRRREHWSQSRPTAHTGSCKEISRAATCHIGQSLERSAPLPPRVGKIPFLTSSIQFVQRYIWYSFSYFYPFCHRATTLS